MTPIDRRSPLALLALLLAALLTVAACSAREPAADATVEGPPAKAEVEPGLNDTWKSDDVDHLVGILERDGREIYAHRQKIVELVDPRPGSAVADVGAGSGFMTLLFARAVGEEGKAYGVDINPTMMDRLAEQAEEEGLANVETVVCPEDSVALPEASVDLVFMADTYHHFEYPAGSLESIHQALRPGGEIVVIDFERIPGESSEWVFEHVRAGKETVIDEITGAGFELVAEPEAPYLADNYVLRFRKVAR